MNESDWQALLTKTGADLKVLDELLVGIYRARLDVAERVVQAKQGMFEARRAEALAAGLDEPLTIGEPIVAKEREEARLDTLRKLAIEYGVSPHFVAAMEYHLINESVKHQVEAFQNKEVRLDRIKGPEMRQNLLALTKAVAANYDGGYDKYYPATRQYVLYEAVRAEEVIDSMSSHLTALDLGCATGPFTSLLVKRFKSVTAVDISPEMCAVAAERLAKSKNVSVVNADFESEEFWDTIAPESFNFVSLSLGTASDVMNIDKLIERLSVVLKRDGKAFLSFYNSKALAYTSGYLPWRSSLAARLDAGLSTITVQNHYVLFARGYTHAELRDKTYPGMHLSSLHSYPTLLPVFPPEFLKSEATLKTICSLEQPNTSKTGAYLVLVLSK